MSEEIYARLLELERRLQYLETLEDGVNDYYLQVARGLVTGQSAVHIFGHAHNGVQTTITDLWERADATPTQQIWTAPTTARIHNVASSSASDDGSPAGVGACTLRFWGLTSWSAAQTSEDITLNGTSNVSTVNSYVIVNKMEVLTHGATSVNVGTITATAATDATVSAVILPGVGITNAAIYGFPSTKTLYLTRFSYSILQSAGAVNAIDYQIAINKTPTTELTQFVTLAPKGVQSNGNSSNGIEYAPYYQIAGPAIIKAQGMAYSADTDGSAAIQGILVDN